MTDPFFIVGSGRCGTNLLRDMLRIHPEIDIPPETHFFLTLCDEFGTDQVNFDEFLTVVENHYSSSGDCLVESIVETEWGEYDRFAERFRSACKREGLTEASFVTFLDRFYEVLYGLETALIGDKTPHYGVSIPTLRELWPDAKFIHLVRDGVYAAESMTHHEGFVKMINADLAVEQLVRCTYDGRAVDFPSTPIDVVDALDFWERVVTKTHSNCQQLPREAYLELKYETLLLNPAGALDRIAEFLAFEMDSQWRRHAVAIPRPFYLRDVRNRFTETEYRRLAERVRPTLETFGYPDERTYDRRCETVRSARYYWRQFQRGKWIKDLGRRVIR